MQMMTWTTLSIQVTLCCELTCLYMLSPSRKDQSFGISYSCRLGRELNYAEAGPGSAKFRVCRARRSSLGLNWRRAHCSRGAMLFDDPILLSNRSTSDRHFSELFAPAARRPPWLMAPTLFPDAVVQRPLIASSSHVFPPCLVACCKIFEKTYFYI